MISTSILDEKKKVVASWKILGIILESAGSRYVATKLA
jgi:hypothetical protein